MTERATERSTDRAALRQHLLTHRIAGDVATPRSSNLANIDKMLDRQWDYWFGLDLDRGWTADAVLKVLADRVGIDPDASRTTGSDTIDVDLTLQALDQAAVLLADAARRRSRVLVATGHPTGVLPIQLAVGEALAAAGCDVVTAGDGLAVRAEHLPPRAHVRYLGRVAMLSNGADFLHTHAAEPMQRLLGEASLAEGLRPDLVLADHGWAGAAAQAGIVTIGLADTNDPAMFVGAAEGKVAVAVPLDDNVLPAAYQPVIGYLLGHLGERD